MAEYQEAERARKKSALTPEGFAVFWYLRREGVVQADVLAREVARALEHFPHWRRTQDQEREVRKCLYKALLKAGVEQEQVVELAERLLTLLRRTAA